MPTRLSIFCERIIESGWLITVLLVPLYYNPYGLRVFDPDKLLLFRSIALIMGLAWLVKITEGQGGEEAEGKKKIFVLPRPPGRLLPIFLACAIFGAIYLVATLTSVAADLSFWGSYQRLQGLYTTFAFLLICALILGELRSAAQFERLLNVIILASWPVALLGILQRFNLSPIDWQSRTNLRVFSSMGNPIFLGAYLVTVIPLTAARLWQSLQAWRVRRVAASGLAAIVIFCILTAQIACLFFSGSRGPWLAFFLGTGFITPLIWLASRHRGAIAGGLVVIVLALATSMFVLNMPGTPLAGLGQVPGMQRLVGILDRDPTVRTRVLIWQGAASLLGTNPARMLAGFGPETTQLVLLPHVPPELFHYEDFRRPDRAHNDAFDALLTRGLLGWLAWLGVFVISVYGGLSRLRLVEGAGRGLIVALLSGALCGGLGAMLLTGHWAYVPLSVALGLIAGLAGFLLAASLRRKPAAPSVPAGEPGQHIVVTGLLGGIVSHFLEINLGGISVSATQLNFWVFAALLALLAWQPQIVSAPQILKRKDPETRRRGDAGITPSLSPPRPSVPLSPALGALLLSTLVFDTIVMGRFDLALHGWRAILLIGLAWLLPVVFVASQAAETSPQDRASMLAQGTRFAILSFIGFAIFLVYAMALFSVGADALPLIGGYWLLVLVYLLVLAWSLLPAGETRQLYASVPRVGVYTVLAALVLLVIHQTNLTPAWADVYAQAASLYARVGLWDESLTLYNRVLTLAPNEVAYYRQAMDMLSRRAQATPDPDPRATWFSRARTVAQKALALQPRDSDNTYNLAHLHLLWARATSDRTQQFALLDQALSYYQQAANLAPFNPEILNEWALSYLLRGDAENALFLYKRSLTIDPQLAQTYIQMSRLYQQSGRLDEAVQAIEQARSIEPTSPEVLSALSDLFLRLDRPDDALQAARQAVALAPENAAGRYALARLYQHLGQLEAALIEAQNALNYATPEQQSALQQFIQELQTRRP